MSTGYSGEKVLVLGATGLLGGSLVPFLVGTGHSVECHGRTNAVEHCVNIAEATDTSRLLSSINPSVIVNLVALTDVDRCEQQPGEAYLTNVRTVENIANWMRQEKPSCHLVHISTDQVYDGVGPHSEEHAMLTNCYAFSKYAGELAAKSVHCSILRTNFFGRSIRSKRASFTDWLFRSLSNKDPIQVFDDVSFSPLSMATVSSMIEVSIRKKPIGLFNLGAKEGMSKADFAYAFAQALDLSTHAVTRTSTDRVAFLKTYRPKDMRMNSSRFENALGLTLPSLVDEIKGVAKEYREIA